MRRRTLAALGLVMLLAGSASLAAPPAKTYSTGRFEVAGVVVPARDVLDARALPDMTGTPSLLVTIRPGAIAALVAAAKGGDVAATLDGKALGASPAAALAQGGALQLSGNFGDYAAAAAIARRISGRDPVPDSEGDE